MAIKIVWLGHAGFKISGSTAVIYIDPWKLSKSEADATVVLVSHSHYDHYSPGDITKVSTPETQLIAPADVIAEQKKGQSLSPGQKIEAGTVAVTGTASYNPAKQFHPKANNWLGFIIELDSVHIYYAGDTELIDEMKTLGNIDIALLPVGGTYTMDASQAAEAAARIKPKCAIPYHWGDIVGQKNDAEQFAKNAQCPVKILTAGAAFDFEP